MTTMEKPISNAIFLVIVIWIELCCAQDCPDIGAVLANSIFGTLAVVGLIIAIIALALWIRRKKGNEKNPNKLQRTRGDGAYDNPNFQSDETNGRPAVTHTVDHAEKGFGGYVECKEYESPRREEGKKLEESSEDSAQRTCPQEARPNGTAPWLPRRLFMSPSRGSLNENKSSPDTEVVTVDFKSQDSIGLGFNVAGNMRDGIYISQILNRGPASESGQVKLGDRILSITVTCENMVYEDALHILSYASPYPVQLCIKRIVPQDDMQQPTEVLQDDMQQPTEVLQGDMQQPTDEDPRVNLLHPIYRSSSMDDLGRICKDNHTPSHQIASEDDKQNSKSINVLQNIETSEMKISSQLEILHKKADRNDLVGGDGWSAGGGMSLENLLSSSAQVLEVDIPGDVGIDDRSTSSMEISTPRQERNESMQHKYISNTNSNCSDTLPSIHSGISSPLRQWTDTQSEDRNNSLVQVSAPELVETYSGLTEEDKLDVLRLSYEDSSAVSLGVRTDEGEEITVTDKGDGDGIADLCDVKVGGDIFSKFDDGEIKEDRFIKIDTDETTDKHVDKIKRDALIRIKDNPTTKECGDSIEAASSTVEMSINTSSARGIPTDFDPEFSVSGLSDNSTDEGISSPQIVDMTTGIIEETVQIDSLVHCEPDMQLNDVQFESKSKPDPDSAERDCVLTEPPQPDQHIVQGVVEKQIILSREETGLMLSKDISLPFSDVVVHREDNSTEFMQVHDSNYRKRDSSDEEDKGFVDVDLLQDKSAPQSPVTNEVKELAVDSMIINEKSQIPYCSISLKPEDFEYRSPTVKRDFVSTRRMVSQSGNPGLALREDESILLEPAQDIPPASTGKVDINGEDRVEEVLKDYLSDSPSLLEELRLAPPASKSKTPAEEEFEVYSLDSEDAGVVRTGSYNVQGSLSSNEPSRTPSPQPELQTEITRVSEMTKPKEWLASSPQVTMKYSDGSSFDISQEDCEEMPLDPPQNERDVPKDGSSFSVNIDKNTFHAIPSEAIPDSRENDESTMYKMSGDTDLSAVDG